MPTSAPFGQIAIKKGYVSPNQLDEVLEEQRLHDRKGGKHELTGMLMLKKGFLTTEQLIQVLRSYKPQESE